MTQMEKKKRRERKRERHSEISANNNFLQAKKYY